MFSIKRCFSYVMALALSIFPSVGAFALDYVGTVLAQETMQKAVAELEQAKQSFAKVTDNKSIGHDATTAHAREHVSMLRGIGSGSGEAAFA